MLMKGMQVSSETTERPNCLPRSSWRDTLSFLVSNFQHSQIRNHSRTMFLNGLNCTKKRAAAPLGRPKLGEHQFLVQQIARDELDSFLKMLRFTRSVRFCEEVPGFLSLIKIQLHARAELQ
jgi:hypothetical protein